MPLAAFLDLTYTELAELDREKTVLASAVSPVEVHGPHLPLGTDVFLAESLRDRAAAAILDGRPGWHVVILPTLTAGSDPIPLPGSVEVPPRILEGLVRAWARALADLGFRYWLLFDNHGGPHHQLALETVAREAARSGLTLICPFHVTFRRMIDLDEGLLAATDLAEGSAGDASDSHAGTNETSLMLAAHPHRVRSSYEGLARGRVSPPNPLTRLVGRLGRLAGRLGAGSAATDLRFISSALAWVSDPAMEAYQGSPAGARAEAGERMLAYHTSVALELFEKAVAGTPETVRPIGWSLRRLRSIV